VGREMVTGTVGCASGGGDQTLAPDPKPTSRSIQLSGEGLSCTVERASIRRAIASLGPRLAMITRDATKTPLKTPLLPTVSMIVSSVIR
jgi:hypothetical protein